MGERINPTGKKRFQQALREGDMNYILEQAVSQSEAGAQVLDVNVGAPGVDEPAVMEQVVKALQSVVSLPLQLDSSHADALERGLRVYNGKPIVNSVNGETEVLERVLPLCKKYGAAVVGLAIDERGIQPSADARFEIAKRVVDAALAHGIPREDIYIDCLTLTASAQQQDVLATVEALARSGVGALDLIDDDKVCLTNINRQIIATHQTIGKYKVDVMEERIHLINPEAQVVGHKCFYLPETADQFDFSQYDYVVDAVDTVTAKIEIILRAKEAGVPVISCMGAGNKLDPTQFRVADIYKTTMCPLAKVMRRELKKRGVKKLKVVYSTEASLKPLETMETSCRTGCVCPPGTVHKCTDRRAIPGSISFVPSVAGLIIGGEVIKDLIQEGKAQKE